MSISGTVISWRGRYGFAITKEGKKVYIHTDEIEGGKLRVGHEVFFDVSKVEGQEEKLKGVKVSGKAVLAKGTKLNEEELSKDRELRNELREEHRQDSLKAFQPVWEEASALSRSNKLALVAKLLDELKLGKIEDYERYPDPAEKKSKKTYTYDEFKAYYGKNAEKVWKTAKRKAQKARAAKAAEAEKSPQIKASPEK